MGPRDWRRVPVPIAREVRRRLGESEPDGPIEVILRNTNSIRMISPTYSGTTSHANTYKFEAFAPKGDAVIKLELIGKRVLVEEFDTADPAGAAINDYILSGLATDPKLTITTKADISTATLYRFD